MPNFVIDTHSPPDLGPIERDRYVFCCEKGCGECQAVLVTFRTGLHTVDGQIVSERTHPEIVSSCCGEPMFVWDNKRDEAADEPGMRTVSIELPGKKPMTAPTPAPEDEQERCECNCRSEHECVFCAQRRQWGG